REWQVELPADSGVAHAPGPFARPRALPSGTLSRGAGEGRNATAGLIPLPHCGRGRTARGSERWVRATTPLAFPAVERGADRDGTLFDDGLRLARLRADDGRRARFQDAGLLAGNRRERVAEKSLVVERDRGDRGRRRMAQQVGRVEAPAKPGFKQHDIGWNAGEGEKRCRRGDLEKGDRLAPVGALAFLEQC